MWLILGQQDPQSGEHGKYCLFSFSDIIEILQLGRASVLIRLETS